MKITQLPTHCFGNHGILIGKLIKLHTIYCWKILKHLRTL